MNRHGTKRNFVVWITIILLTFSSFTIYAAGSQRDYQRNEASKALLEVKAAGEVALEQAGAAVETAEKKTEEKRKAAERAAAERKYEQYIAGLASYIRHVNRNVADGDAAAMARHFVDYGREYGVDEKLAMAVAHNESTFYSSAVSSEDFKGLMQTGDGLARNAGYDPGQLFDYRVSIDVGTRYLGIKMKEFGDARLALTAYNQGSGSVHSGNYSTGYADLAISRAKDIGNFLSQNGYR